MNKKVIIISAGALALCAVIVFSAIAPIAHAAQESKAFGNPDGDLSVYDPAIGDIVGYCADQATATHYCQTQGYQTATYGSRWLGPRLDNDTLYRWNGSSYSYVNGYACSSVINGLVCYRDTCTANSSQRCVGNSIYWFDSCGNQQELAQQCTSNQTCQAAAKIGNDTTARVQADLRSNFTVIDTNHPATVSANITSFAYHAANTNPFKFVVVNSSKVVQWISPSITPSAIGVNTYTPPSPVPVQPGWNIGMYFSSTGTITFAFTGATASWTAEGAGCPGGLGCPVVGSSLTANESGGRTYSFVAALNGAPINGDFTPRCVTNVNQYCANGTTMTYAEFMAAKTAGKITLTWATQGGQEIVHINNTTGCTAPVISASYKIFIYPGSTGWLSTQKFNADSGVVNIAANGNTDAAVNISPCLPQVDLWYQTAPHSFTADDASGYAGYNLIDGGVIWGPGLCTSATPGPTPTPTTQPTVCNTSSDCGTNTFVGGNFCQNGSVYRNYQRFTCNNPGTANSTCSNATAPVLWYNCDFSTTCSNGYCYYNNPTTACNTSSDCGTNGFVGNTFCQNGSVYKNYRTYTCSNPGTTNATCSNSLTPILWYNCDFSTTCNNGYCYYNPQNVACNTSSDCGTNGFVGNTFCQNGSVYKNYQNYTCNNPGTTQSSCSNSTTPVYWYGCASGQTCSNGFCTGNTCTPNYVGFGAGLPYTKDAMGGTLKFTLTSLNVDSTGNYSVNINAQNTTGVTKTIHYAQYKCLCPQAAGHPAGVCDQCTSTPQTLVLAPYETKLLVANVQQPSQTMCGSSQLDMAITDVNGVAPADALDGWMSGTADTTCNDCPL